MNKVETVHILIETGQQGTDSPVRMRFNGHEVEMQTQNGSTARGATYEGSFDVHSVAHSVFLLGPESGSWDLERVVARYTGPEAVENEYGAMTLAPGAALDIWTKETPSYDV